MRVLPIVLTLALALAGPALAADPGPDTAPAYGPSCRASTIPARSRLHASRRSAKPCTWPTSTSQPRDGQRPHGGAAARQELLRRDLGRHDRGSDRGRLSRGRARPDRLLQVEQARALPVQLPATRRTTPTPARHPRHRPGRHPRPFDRRHAGGPLCAALPGMRPQQLVLVDPIGLEDWTAKGVPPIGVDQWYARDLKTTADEHPRLRAGHLLRRANGRTRLRALGRDAGRHVSRPRARSRGLGFGAALRHDHDAAGASTSSAASRSRRC